MVYAAKYVRISKIKELLIHDDQKIRVSGDAKEKLAEYLDNAIENATIEMINKLPRKTKGEGKGQLKRITFQVEDFK